MPRELAREIFRNATVTLHGNQQLPDEIRVNKSKTGNSGKNQRLIPLMHRAAIDFAFQVKMREAKGGAPEAWVLSPGNSPRWKDFSGEMHKLVIKARTRSAQSKPTSST